MHGIGTNKEFFQKYCSHIGGNVTMAVEEEGPATCLCSHLCHGKHCENRSFNTVLRRCGENDVDINENLRTEV